MFSVSRKIEWMRGCIRLPTDGVFTNQQLQLDKSKYADTVQIKFY